MIDFDLIGTHVVNLNRTVKQDRPMSLLVVRNSML